MIRKKDNINLSKEFKKAKKNAKIIIESLKKIKK